MKLIEDAPLEEVIKAVQDGAKQTNRILERFYALVSDYILNDPVPPEGAQSQLYGLILAIPFIKRRAEDLLRVNGGHQQMIDYWHKIAADMFAEQQKRAPAKPEMLQ